MRKIRLKWQFINECHGILLKILKFASLRQNQQPDLLCNNKMINMQNDFAKSLVQSSGNIVFARLLPHKLAAQHRKLHANEPLFVCNLFLPAARTRLKYYLDLMALAAKKSILATKKCMYTILLIE